MKKNYYGKLSTCTRCGGETEKKRNHYYGGIKCLKCQAELRKEYREKIKLNAKMVAEKVELHLARD